MELDIAALSMNMAAANLQQGVSIGMMKKTMESTQQAMETITDMLDSMPSPRPYCVRAKNTRRSASTASG